MQHFRIGQGRIKKQKPLKESLEWRVECRECSSILTQHLGELGVGKREEDRSIQEGQQQDWVVHQAWELLFFTNFQGLLFLMWGSLIYVGRFKVFWVLTINQQPSFLLCREHNIVHYGEKIVFPAFLWFGCLLCIILIMHVFYKDKVADVNMGQINTKLYNADFNHQLFFLIIIVIITQETLTSGWEEIA